MAVIHFDESDLLAAKTLEKGPQTVEISEIVGPVASKTQKSVHFWVTFKIVRGLYANKEHKVSFNTETQNASLLGSMQFFPHRDLVKVKEAIEGASIKDKSIDIDTDDLLHKPFDAMFNVETVDGSLINIVTAFAPAGKMVGSTPF